ncbi:MAG: CotH kinase family protein [Polyangiales bacterium]
MMRTSMRQLGNKPWFLLVCVVMGCGTDPVGSGVTKRACEESDSVACECSNGSTGVRRCTPDGTLRNACECGSSSGPDDEDDNAGGTAGNKPSSEGRAGTGGKPSGASHDAGTGGSNTDEPDHPRPDDPVQPPPAGTGGKPSNTGNPGGPPFSGDGEAGSSGAPGDAGHGDGDPDPAVDPEPTPEPEPEPPPGPDPNGPEVVSEPTDDASYLFDPSTVRSYDILVDPNDLAAIDANPGAEASVPASVVFEGQTYGPYSVRYKGSAGSFKPPCLAGALGSPRDGKCSMKLDFNDTDPEARFYGLKKLNFHSMNSDASFMRDRLGYTMFREMGVASPRAMHARVSINGQLQGLYIAVEQVDGRFSRARFAEGGDGNIYKEIWPMYTDAPTYQNALETNEDVGAVQRMLDFKSAIDSGSDATAEWLDLDYMTRYLAVDRVIINDDSIMRFWCNQISQGNNPGPIGNHNYYWYEAEAQNRFWLIPWDLDHSFDSIPYVHVHPEWNSSGTECLCHDTVDFGYQYPAACDPLMQRFISWDSQFQAQTDAFLAGPFAKAHVDELLAAWRTQIQPIVAEAQGINRAISETEWADGLTTLEGKIESAREHRGYAY